MISTSIVLGLGFGDEGKGLTTDYLCLRTPGSLVVRFSGGHQVGHTVVKDDGTRHVFSNFGAGSFRKSPTFMSRFCTISPSGISRERDVLNAIGVHPKLFLSPLAMVTTPFDIAYNRAVESLNRHGSVGVGFGTTIERNETPWKLYARDLGFPWVLQEKLKAVAIYYREKARQTGNPQLVENYLSELEKFQMEAFLADCERTRRFARILPATKVFAQFKHLIFEGSQGILLDMDEGFFPHVTRSHTTSRNAHTLLREHGLPKPEVFYITRAYQTRHGNGPMSNEHLDLQLKNTEKETNVSHDWQGDFRRTVLDLDLINYALTCDDVHSGVAKKHLVMTCLDQIDGDWKVSMGGKEFTPTGAVDLLDERYLYGTKLDSLIESWSPSGERLVRKKVNGHSLNHFSSV